MWKLNQFISSDDGDASGSLLEEESDGLCSLSPTQRMYAFAACFVAGFAFMFLGVVNLFIWAKIVFCVLDLMYGMAWCVLVGESLIVFVKPIKFALLFTIGNMLAVGSTAFLIGPSQQLTMMFDPTRVYATTIYIGFVVISLVCALWIHSKILTLIAIVCEICALIWYSLTYVPFARRMVSGLTIRLFDTEI